MFVTPAFEAAWREWLSASSLISVTVTCFTRRAKSMLIVPGPAPTSSRRAPGVRCGARYAAEFSTVRHECERRTGSLWPCV